MENCPVIGVYNASQNFFADLAQCVVDKLTFPSLSRGGDQQSVVEKMEWALRRNPASVALFRLLRRPELRMTPIFAHSQGNLIASNAVAR